MIEHKSTLTEFYWDPRWPPPPPTPACFVKPFYVLVFKHSRSNQDVS